MPQPRSMTPAEVNDMLPWHVPLWQRLHEARRADRLPHALLLTGIAGLGKRRLAEQFAHSLLCERPGPSGNPCAACRGCRLFLAGTHPDLRIIAPPQEDHSGEIRIDAIRAPNEGEAQPARSGGYKLFILEPAERMTFSAANSLLNALEEPAPGVVMILITATPQKLPATIRSRCQRLDLPVPSEKAALEWLGARVESAAPLVLLRLANGAPLRALALAGSPSLQQRDEVFVEFLALSERSTNPLLTAEAWIKLDQRLLLGWLYGWVGDLLRLATGHRDPRLTNPDKRAALQRLAGRLPARLLQEFLQQLLRARALVDTTVNPQLLLESLLIRWVRLARRP